jgi:alanyl-tRNA synthetase
VKVFPDRDLNFIKLLAQKLTRESRTATALLATAGPQPAFVFAQSAGQPNDMGAVLKETVAKLGGRGGGSKDLAQGGVPSSEGLDAALTAAAHSLTR